MRYILNKLEEWLIFFLVLAILVIAGGAYGGWYFWQEFVQEKQGLLDTIAGLEIKTKNLETERNDLFANLENEKTRNDQLAEQVGEIAGTVGILEKLKNTDKELLQKYSKVSFLNENYVPDLLTNVDSIFVLSEEKKILIHAKVWPFLEKMLKAAERDGVDIKVLSGFRSFGEQSSLKASYKLTYGSNANQFSADQGYSEHQLGTTVDLTTPTIGGAYNGFAQSEAYQWLLKNAYRYGFSLSYPEKNTYYQFEPWHWRFVGEELARDLHRDDKYFYDLDQREIDKYLVSIFD